MPPEHGAPDRELFTRSILCCASLTVLRVYECALLCQLCVSRGYKRGARFSAVYVCVSCARADSARHSSQWRLGRPSLSLPHTTIVRRRCVRRGGVVWCGKLRARFLAAGARGAVDRNACSPPSHPSARSYIHTFIRTYVRSPNCSLTLVSCRSRSGSRRRSPLLVNSYGELLIRGGVCVRKNRVGWQPEERERKRGRYRR